MHNFAPKRRPLKKHVNPMTIEQIYDPFEYPMPAKKKKRKVIRRRRKFNTNVQLEKDEHQIDIVANNRYQEDKEENKVPEPDAKAQEPEGGYYQMASAMIFQVPSDGLNESTGRNEEESNQVLIEQPTGNQDQFELAPDTPENKSKSASRPFLFSNE